jgi:hypothetical protein
MFEFARLLREELLREVEQAATDFVATALRDKESG